MPLEALQANFAAAMADAGREADLMQALQPGDPRTADRIALYRGNLAAAWEKALANAYPVVKALVGEEFFEALARVYAQAHPSTSGDLNRFGEHFAGFVATFEHTRPLPYLPDVAALEWAVHRAHYAADAVPVAREAIAALQPHELLARRFALHPACAWVASRFPVADIWLAHQPDSTVGLPESLDRRQAALVVRPHWRAEVVETDRAEIAALEALRTGSTIEASIDAALAIEPDFDFARALLGWLEWGVLVESPRGDPAGSR